MFKLGRLAFVFLALDVGFGHFTADLILVLSRRGLHEVGGRGIQWTGDTAVAGKLHTAHGVNDHACAVGTVPDFEFGFEVERHVAEGCAFHADVAPFAVRQPGHVIAGADMHIIGIQFVGQHGGDGAGLGDLLGFKTFAFEHVHEIGVAAEIELIGVIEQHAAIHEEAGDHAVQNGGAKLTLDVVADDRQTGIQKALAPIFRGGDEDGDGVDHADAGFEDLFDIPLGGHFRTDGQVVDDHVRFGVFEYLDDVGGGAGGLGEDLGEILAQSVMGHTADNRYVLLGNVAEFVGIVGVRENSLREVFADLGVDHVDGRGEFYIIDVISAEVDMHQTGDAVGVFGVLVELHALNERRGAVTYAYNSNTYFFTLAHWLFPP